MKGGGRRRGNQVKEKKGGYDWQKPLDAVRVGGKFRKLWGVGEKTK